MDVCARTRRRKQIAPLTAPTVSHAYPPRSLLSGDLPCQLRSLVRHARPHCLHPAPRHHLTSGRPATSGHDSHRGRNTAPAAILTTAFPSILAHHDLQLIVVVTSFLPWARSARLWQASTPLQTGRLYPDQEHEPVMSNGVIAPSALSTGVPPRPSTVASPVPTPSSTATSSSQTPMQPSTPVPAIGTPSPGVNQNGTRRCVLSC